MSRQASRRDGPQLTRPSQPAPPRQANGGRGVGGGRGLSDLDSQERSARAVDGRVENAPPAATGSETQPTAGPGPEGLIRFGSFGAAEDPAVKPGAQLPKAAHAQVPPSGAQVPQATQAQVPQVPHAPQAAPRRTDQMSDRRSHKDNADNHHHPHSQPQHPPQDNAQHARGAQNFPQQAAGQYRQQTMYAAPPYPQPNMYMGGQFIPNNPYGGAPAYGAATQTQFGSFTGQPAYHPMQPPQPTYGYFQAPAVQPRAQYMPQPAMQPPTQPKPPPTMSTVAPVAKRVLAIKDPETKEAVDVNKDKAGGAKPVSGPPAKDTRPGKPAEAPKQAPGKQQHSGPRSFDRQPPHTGGPPPPPAAKPQPSAAKEQAAQPKQPEPAGKPAAPAKEPEPAPKAAVPVKEPEPAQPEVAAPVQAPAEVVKQPEAAEAGTPGTQPAAAAEAAAVAAAAPEPSAEAAAPQPEASAQAPEVVAEVQETPAAAPEAPAKAAAEPAAPEVEAPAAAAAPPTPAAAAAAEEAPVEPSTPAPAAPEAADATPATPSPAVTSHALAVEDMDDMSSVPPSAAGTEPPTPDTASSSRAVPATPASAEPSTAAAPADAVHQAAAQLAAAVADEPAVEQAAAVAEQAPDVEHPQAPGTPDAAEEPAPAAPEEPVVEPSAAKEPEMVQPPAAAAAEPAVPEAAKAASAEEAAAPAAAAAEAAPAEAAAPTEQVAAAAAVESTGTTADKPAEAAAAADVPAKQAAAAEAAPEAIAAAANGAPATEVETRTAEETSTDGASSSAPAAASVMERAPSGKKKSFKATLAKKDAASSKGDLLDVYRVPKKGEVEAAPAPPPAAAEPAPAAPAPPPAPAPAPAPEPVAAVADDDDWEDKAEAEEGELLEMTSRAASVSAKPEASVERVVYTRDWMKSIQDQFTERAPGLDTHPYAADFLAVPDGGGARFRQPDMGRAGSGPLRGAAPADDKWSARGPPPDARVPGGRGAGPPPPALMNRQPSAREPDRWQQRGPLPGPPPPPGIRGPGGAAPGGRQATLHKTDDAYKPGKSRTDDPQEEAKQRKLRSILNKLTPENFDKLVPEIQAVGIEEKKTLEGLIDQIFDKALTETTFSDMYSLLCRTIQDKVPDFEDPESGVGTDGKPRKINFRRLMLNKCQEEFEKGDAAMAAVEQREKKEREDAEAGIVKPSEDKEEGEITDDAKKAREDDRAAAAAELKARRRALGNIQFIGHLYRQRILIEKIMHSCIVKLLSNEDNPRQEDLECLCKLMATIGGQLEKDKQNVAAGGNLIGAYFLKIAKFTKNPALDSRIRFTLVDLIELRERGWQSRRKTEGPKKIADIHADAVKEMSGQSGPNSRDARGPPPGPSRGGPPTGGRDEGRGRMPPPDSFSSGGGGNFPRTPSRGELSMVNPGRAPNAPFQGLAGAQLMRTSSNDVELRPQGPKISMRMPSRPAAVPEAAPVLAPSAAAAPAAAEDVPERVPTPSPPGIEDSETEKKARGMVREYTQNRTDAGILEVLRELKGLGANMDVAMAACIREALEARQIPVEDRLAPYHAVFRQEVSAADGSLTAADLTIALSTLLRDLQDMADDMPKAPVIFAEFLADFVADGQIALKDIGPAVIEGSEPAEEGGESMAVEQGTAQTFATALLKKIKELAGEDKAAALWRESGLKFQDFVSEMDQDGLEETLQKAGIAFAASS